MTISFSRDVTSLDLLYQRQGVPHSKNLEKTLMRERALGQHLLHRQQQNTQRQSTGMRNPLNRSFVSKGSGEKSLFTRALQQGPSSGKIGRAHV